MVSFDAGLIWYISAVEVVSLVIALVLVTLAYRGYRRSGSRSLLLAAVGFAILGVASLTEGLLFSVVGLSLDEAHAFRSTLTAFGLLVLLYSIYKTRQSSEQRTDISSRTLQTAKFCASVVFQARRRKICKLGLRDPCMTGEWTSRPALHRCLRGQLHQEHHKPVQGT